MCFKLLNRGKVTEKNVINKVSLLKKLNEGVFKIFQNLSRSAGLRRFQDTVPRVWWVRSGEGGGVELFETADLRSGGVYHGTRTF